MKFLTYAFPPWARVAIIVALAMILFGYGVHVGQLLERGSNVRAEHRTEATLDKRDANGSVIATQTRAEGGATQAAIQGETHASQARIQVVYRDHPVGGDCRQPHGVSVELDQAIEAANRRVRAAASPSGGPPSG